MNYPVLAATIVCGICNVAMAASQPTVPEPPMPPSNYHNGPESPLLSDTGIFSAERAAYALLEGVMQQAETVIAATSCSNSVGAFDVWMYADGSVRNPGFNFVTVDSSASTFTLNADIYPDNSFRGQAIRVTQAGGGALKKVNLISFISTVYYNAQSSIMTMNSASSVVGINGLPDTYQIQEIKDFYRKTDTETGLPYILDWGLQSVSKLGFPIQKYWQRSKSLRDNGVIGRTVFIKDRLVGPNACRIAIDMSGTNNQDYFWQSGTLTISQDLPSTDYPMDF